MHKRHRFKNLTINLLTMYNVGLWMPNSYQDSIFAFLFYKFLVSVDSFYLTFLIQGSLCYQFPTHTNN